MNALRRESRGFQWSSNCSTVAAATVDQRLLVHATGSCRRARELPRSSYPSPRASNTVWRMETAVYTPPLQDMQSRRTCTSARIPADDRMSVSDAASAVGISTHAFYRAVRLRHVPVGVYWRIGRSIRVSRSGLRQWLSGGGTAMREETQSRPVQSNAPKSNATGSDSVDAA